MKIFRSSKLGLKVSSEIFKENDGIQIDSFDVTKFEEYLNLDYDLIELGEEEARNLFSFFKVLDVKTQTLGCFDSLIRINGVYKPLQLDSLSFIHFLQQSKVILNATLSAVVVGCPDKLMMYGMDLSKLGLNRIYLVSPENKNLKGRIEHLQKTLLGVHIEQVMTDKISDISDSCGLLIVDFDKAKNSELVQDLTYFNFLAEKAIFLDIRGYEDFELSSEAEKASLQVLKSEDFIKFKYTFCKKN
ncbi:MAG: hypothetical protein ACK41T_04740 [Pseudobdellovibrio sp.]